MLRVQLVLLALIVGCQVPTPAQQHSQYERTTQVGLC
jgi:hypothetical protein